MRRGALLIRIPVCQKPGTLVQYVRRVTVQRCGTFTVVVQENSDLPPPSLPTRKQSFFFAFLDKWSEKLLLRILLCREALSIKPNDGRRAQSDFELKDAFRPV